MKNIVIIISLLIVHLITGYLILENSKVIRSGDEWVRLRESFEYSKLPNVEILRKVFDMGKIQCHPMLFSAVGAFCWKYLYKLGLFYNEPLRILVPNLFFLAILLLSVYGIIKILYEDDELSLLGAVLISFIPVIYSISRVYMIDFPLMSMVALSVFILLKTDLFGSRVYSILAGIVFGLSQATKETFPIFIVPVVIFFIFYSIKEKRQNFKSIAVNLFLTVVIFLVISLLIYYPHANVWLKRYGNVPFFQNNPGGLYYFYSFIFLYFHPLLMLVYAPLFVVFILNLKYKHALLLIWLVPAVIVFSFFPNKDPRFIFPVIPAFFIACLGGLRSLPSFKKYYCILLIFLSSGLFLTLFYLPGVFNYSQTIKIWQNRYLNCLTNQQCGISMVQTQKARCSKFVEQLIDTINNDSGGKMNVLIYPVVLPSNNAPCVFSEFGNKLLFSNYSIRLLISPFLADREIFLRCFNFKEQLEYFNNADYVLCSGINAKDSFDCPEKSFLFNEILGLLKKEKNKWHLVKIFYFSQDVEPVYLYKKSVK